MAEETKNPARDIPIGLVGSMTVKTAIYCLLAVTLCVMQPYNELDVDAPYSVAFAGIRWVWAKYVVTYGALKGMTSILLAGAIGQACYLTHIRRTHMMPPWLALVDEKENKGLLERDERKQGTFVERRDSGLLVKKHIY